MDHQPEEELANLILSIKMKTARLRSQIEALQLLSEKRDSFAKNRMNRSRSFFEEEDQSREKALVGSVSINYANEKLWFSPTVSLENVCSIEKLKFWMLTNKNLEGKCHDSGYRKSIKNTLSIYLVEKAKKREV